MHYIIFAFILAISTQVLNLMFIKFNYFNEYNFYLKMFFVILTLSPFVLGLNYLFALYYRIYHNNIDYVTLYMSFIVFSVIISFFIQYLIYHSTNINFYKIIGIIMSLVGIYLILKR